MATIGNITGRLQLHVDDNNVFDLGAVSVPLTAKTKTWTWDGDREVVVGVSADIEKVRASVEALFKAGAGQ